MRSGIIGVVVVLALGSCGENAVDPVADEMTSCGEGCDTSSSDAGPEPSGASSTGGGSDGSDTGGESSGAVGTSSGAVDDSGPSPSYDPCPHDAPCRYMPLGDSITEGYEGGYRIALFRSVLSAGQDITFVGSMANGPDEVDGVPFSRAHEGHSGYSIDATHSPYNLDDLVDEAIATHQPHIIALMIGTNDVARNAQADSPERLALLLDHLTTIAPDALVVLAQITPTQTDEDNQRVEAYNAAMPAIVEARTSLGKHIVLVDMYGAFTADPDYRVNLMYDNFHPGAAGDEVLAAVWYAAIAEFLG